MAWRGSLYLYRRRSPLRAGLAGSRAAAAERRRGACPRLAVPTVCFFAALTVFFCSHRLAVAACLAPFLSRAVTAIAPPTLMITRPADQPA